MNQTEIKFETRQELLSSFLTGTGRQVTILVDDTEKYQIYATYENFKLTDGMSEAETLELKNNGYCHYFKVGEYYFLAKTVIRYQKRFAEGFTEPKPLPLSEPSWVLDKTLGEIRPDWQEMLKLNQKF